MIDDLSVSGVAYRDMAVLVRSRAAYPELLGAFATFDIPVQPGGRTGLFAQPESRLLGHTYCWLAGTDWRDTYGPPQEVHLDALIDEYVNLFDLPSSRRRRLADFLRDWQHHVPKESRSANLVGEFYALLDQLDVRDWDLNDRLSVNRLGTLARFSSLLADYESVRRRARRDVSASGEQVGGQDRGTWYYRNLAIHIVNYTQGAYEGFDGEPDQTLDAVDLLTVHGAKGLEWPVVFVPSMTSGRFPSSKTGKAQSWLVPSDRFAADRYEGSDADERRLFYVAMTRARDFLSVSHHQMVKTKRVAASPYFEDVAHLRVDPDEVLLPAINGMIGEDDDPINLTYSELAAFLECGQEFRLRNLVGFEPRLAAELGYGKAVHHLMRAVAEATQARGRIPDVAEVDRIVDAGFFLPTANKAAHRQLRGAAHRLVMRYIEEHPDDLYRVWQTERPFELHLDGVVVNGRADVILDKEDGVPSALAIVDYKTSTRGEVGDHALQLQIYSDAGRREGLDVRAAYVHDMKAAKRESIPIGPTELAVGEGTAVDAAARIRARDYAPRPGRRCKSCEVRTVCAAAITR